MTESSRKENVLWKVLGFIALYTAALTVNSCCNLLFYTPKEPKLASSLKKVK